jgi:hypothetical protein
MAADEAVLNNVHNVHNIHNCEYQAEFFFPSSYAPIYHAWAPLAEIAIDRLCT